MKMTQKCQLQLDRPNKANANSPSSIAKRVSIKLEENDFKSAVYLAYSEDTLAESCEDSLNCWKDTTRWTYRPSNLLLTLTIHSLLTQLKSNFKVFYIDDGTINWWWCQSSCIKSKASWEGSEWVGSSTESLQTWASCPRRLRKWAPGNCSVSLQSGPTYAMLSVLQLAKLPLSILLSKKKVKFLKIMGSRLSFIQIHDTLVFLWYSLLISMILPILHSVLCFLLPVLDSFDEDLRSILSNVFKIDISIDSVWYRAALSVSLGVIRLRRATQFASSAFLLLLLVHPILSIRFSHKNYRTFLN